MDNAKLSQRAAQIFKGILVVAGLVLAFLMINDYRTNQEIAQLNEKFSQVKKIKDDVIHYHELMVMATRMHDVTHDDIWQQSYKSYQVKLNVALKQAKQLSPELYRQETDGINIVAVDKLNLLLTKQVEAALALENSKAYFARSAVITVLVLLLLSWLVIIRITRRYQEELLDSNKSLFERTRELDELNRTLDEKVQERGRALQLAQSQLLQTEKLASVGQLAAGLAHEINNPIGFINSNLQTLEQYASHYSKLLGILNKLEKALKDDDKDRIETLVFSWQKIRQETNFEFIDDDIGKLIKESREGAERIRRIVQDVRSLSSPDLGVVSSVEIEPLIESMINVAWNEIKYKAQLTRDYQHVPKVKCNAQKMSQVFLNLLLNAAGAITKKGLIAVKTYVKNQCVFIDIKDNGEGISPNLANRIFDPFFTTKAPGQGVGLGLSLSFDIVKRHGGNITFDSKIGEGTTFTVMLPVL